MNGDGARAAEVGEVRRQPGGLLFWLTAAIGWVIIANGVRGIVENRVDTRPLSLARFVVGGALVHDVVVAPLVVLVGVVVARAIRGRARAPVQAAIVISAVVTLFAYPLVRGYGRVLRNPSSLPRDYGAGLAVIVGVVWAITIVVLLVQRRARPAPATATVPTPGG